jgi:hypothetical protein
MEEIDQLTDLNSKALGAEFNRITSADPEDGLRPFWMDWRRIKVSLGISSLGTRLKRRTSFLFIEAAFCFFSPAE